MTGLAKVGAAILILFSLLWILVGGLLAIVGREFFRNNATFSGLGDITAAQAGAVAVGFGIVILAIGIVHLLSGIFAWRGNGFWRVVGTILAVIFGLFTGFGALGAMRAAAATDSTGSGVGVTLAFAAGYIYTAIVFIFAYRRAR